MSSDARNEPPSAAAAPSTPTGVSSIPAARPHWYAPQGSVDLRDQVKKWFGPAGEWTEHESFSGTAGLAIQGLAGLFGTLVASRDFLYSHGVIRPYRASLPVISVGNLTTGGAGKTPFVAMLAGWLRSEGYRPAVVARGYGAARVGRPNDEMMELDLVLNNSALVRRGGAGPAAAAVNASGSSAAIAISAAGSGSQFAVLSPSDAELRASASWPIPMIASPARRYGAVLAEQMGADVVILDDGMQHRQIARDLDIVLLDARDPLGPGSNDAGRGPLEGGEYLPAGHMREGLWALERAGLIVIARTSLATPLWLQRLVEELRVRVPDVPIVLADHRPSDLIPHPALVGKKRHSPQSLERRRIGAFCGIANPEAFGKTLRTLGAQMRFSQSFPDHHLYRPQELKELADYARRRNCEVLVTTAKDLTKIPTWSPDDVPLYALRIKMEIQEGRAELEQAVRGVLKKR